MKYLDYLETHSWEELPEEVQREISRADYASRRDLAMGMSSSGNTGLPPVLAAAFSQATKEAVARPQGAKVVVNRRARRPWLLAAAGWLLFAVAAATLLLRAPEETIVYRVISADIPEPEVVVRVDTLRETEVQTVVQYRTVHDTVFVEQPRVEFVSVTDTLYVPMPLSAGKEQLVSGSRSLAGRERMTRLLFATE